MDIFSRVISAPRVDLTIAMLGTLLSAAVGTTIGALAGYYEGQRTWRTALSTFVMRAADVLQAFPVFVFAIALVAVFGQSVRSIVVGDRLREHADLSAADAQPGAVHPPAALRRSRLYRRRVRSSASSPAT